MNDKLEGTLLANAAMLHGMICLLLEKSIISPADVALAVSDAEEWLATQRPAIMSAEGRDYAREVLRAGGAAFGGKPQPG